MKEKMGIYIDKDNKEKLKILAIKSKTSASDIINELITKYLLETEKHQD